MKFAADAKKLHHAIKAANAACTNQSPNDMLRMIRATAHASANQLTLEATDYDLGLRLTAPTLDMTAGGQFVIDPKKWLPLLALTDGEVVVRFVEDELTISDDAGSYSLPVRRPEDHPGVEAIPDDLAVVTVAAGVLAQSLSRVVIAAAEEDGKYTQRAVLLELDDAGNQYQAVATNGKQLAVCPTNYAIGSKISGLVPTRSTKILIAACNDTDPATVVTLAMRHSPGSQFYARMGDWSMTSRLVEGRFPPYRDVVPKRFGTVVNVRVGDLANAVAKARLMTDEASVAVRFEFDGEKSVTLTAQGATSGKGRVACPLVKHEGPAMHIEFDPFFIAEMLRELDPEDEVKWSLINHQKSSVFTDSTGEYTYLVVPIVRVAA